MSVHTTAVIHEERLGASTVSWGAIFAGLVLSLIVYLVLSVLGTAIGASAIDPLGDRNPFSGFGVGAGIWAGVTTLLAIAVGGFVAGYFARRSGALHGLLAWGMTTLVTVYLVVSATGTALNAAGGAAKTGLTTVGAVPARGFPRRLRRWATWSSASSTRPASRWMRAACRLNSKSCCARAASRNCSPKT